MLTRSFLLSACKVARYTIHHKLSTFSPDEHLCLFSHGRVIRLSTFWGYYEWCTCAWYQCADTLLGSIEFLFCDLPQIIFCACNERGDKVHLVSPCKYPVVPVHCIEKVRLYSDLALPLIFKTVMACSLMYDSCQS